MLYADVPRSGSPLVDRSQPGRVRVHLVNHPESETCIRGAEGHKHWCAGAQCLVRLA